MSQPFLNGFVWSFCFNISVVVSCIFLLSNHTGLLVVSYSLFKPDKIVYSVVFLILIQMMLLKRPMILTMPLSLM